MLKYIFLFFCETCFGAVVGGNVLQYKVCLIWKSYLMKGKIADRMTSRKNNEIRKLIKARDILHKCMNHRFLRLQALKDK